MIHRLPPFPRVATVFAAGALLLSGCASSDPLADSAPPRTSSAGSLVIGSANFPESEILAYVYADALQDNGVKASVKPNIGARDAYIAALKDGSVDMVPEYTGNLLQYFDPGATAHTPEEVSTALKKSLPSGLQTLDEAKAQDADTFNVTPEFSGRYHVTSLADLASLGIDLRIGAPSEFAAGAYGLPGLKKKYGVDPVLVPINDGGGPNTVKALLDGQVQLADIYSSTPSIRDNGLVTLADPQHLILAQNVVPLIDTGKAGPTITKTLNEVQAHLSTEDLVRMNAKSYTEKESAEVIARQWLDSKELFR